jgi:hypothetical protein
MKKSKINYIDSIINKKLNSNYYLIQNTHIGFIAQSTNKTTNYQILSSIISGISLTMTRAKNIEAP